MGGGSAAAGLPGGLVIDERTGVISGKAKVTGTSTVTAADRTGASGPVSFVWTVTG